MPNVMQVSIVDTVFTIINDNLILNAFLGYG